MEGSEEKFLDTTHGCSFFVMLIISSMAINGFNVLMVPGVVLYHNVQVGEQTGTQFSVTFK